MEFTSIMTEAVKPELLVLIPVLYLIGAAVKKTNKINNKYIPLILGCLGVAFALVYVLATAEDLSNFQSVLLVIFSAVVQGILCAGACVYGDQTIKQLFKK